MANGCVYELFNCYIMPMVSTAMRRTYPQPTSHPAEQLNARCRYLPALSKTAETNVDLRPQVFYRDIRNAFPFVVGGTDKPGYR